MTHVTWWRSSSDKKNLVFHLADNSVAVSQKNKKLLDLLTCVKWCTSASKKKTKTSIRDARDSVFTYALSA